MMAENWAESLFLKMERKFEAECIRMGDKIPYRATDGVYETDYARKDIYWWTNGFWPGILWKMYHATGKEMYRQRAEKAEETLDQALHGFIGLHHDTGFMWLHSAVANYRLTGSAKARIRGLKAASVLAGRYNPKGQYLRAWNPECVESGEDCSQRRRLLRPYRLSEPGYRGTGENPCRAGLLCRLVLVKRAVMDSLRLCPVLPLYQRAGLSGHGQEMRSLLYFQCGADGLYSPL